MGRFMTTPTCISYIRFSTDRQAHGSSLERQLKMSREYAAKHGYTIDEKYTYKDLGVSAYTGENAKFGDLRRFLNAIENGDIARGSILLVESLDRLSRESVLDAFSQFQAILKEDIKVVTLCDGKEYTKESMNENFNDLIISLSVMMRANEESKIKSKRIREGFEKKRKNLANVKMTSNAPTWLKLIKETNSFTLVEDRVDIVRRIFQMSYDGLGIITIARQLNKEKIPAFRSSKGWYQSTVRKILSSRSVIGEYQPHIFRKGMKKPEPVGDVILNYFPAIIADDLYYAVQARLSNGTHKAGRTAKVENLFGGMTNCGYCGARMDVVTHGKSIHDIRYLTCTSAKSGVGCSYIAFKCNELEHAFLEFCKDRELLDVLNLESNRDKDNKNGLLHQLSAKNGELLNIDKKIRILDDDLSSTSDKLLREHFKNNLNTLLHNKSGLEKNIAELSNEITTINLSFEDVDTRVNNILDIIDKFKDSSSEEEFISFRIKLRNILRQIISKVIVYPRGNRASDDQIEKMKLEFDAKINSSDDLTRDILCYEREVTVDNMLNSQRNTTADRYFEIYFKNGNFRRIKYCKENSTFVVSFDRLGNTINWSSRGMHMKSIVLDDDKQLIKTEVELYKKNLPDLNMTQE